MEGREVTNVQIHKCIPRMVRLLFTAAIVARLPNLGYSQAPPSEPPGCSDHTDADPCNGALGCTWDYNFYTCGPAGPPPAGGDGGDGTGSCYDHTDEDPCKGAEA
eukprot:COSAG02_NODE_17728_length_985_cov_0.786682_2_plen_105_part_00